MRRNVLTGAFLAIVSSTVAPLNAMGTESSVVPYKLSQLASEETIGDVEVVAVFDGAMPTGVTVTETGRIFVCFPRWGDKVPYTVGEVTNQGVIAYPNLELSNGGLPQAKTRFISVQSVIADGKGYLWVLDTAAPAFSTPEVGGAKLVAIDLKTNQIVKSIVFSQDVVLPTTYLNDMRFDFRVGKSGVAYITDSSTRGPGGIIVVDLDSGSAFRRLTGDPSTSPEKGFMPTVEGKILLQRSPDGNVSPLSVASDGIALSPDGKTLYYSPLSGRHLYSVPTDLLRDIRVTEQQLSKKVTDWGEKGASDGLEADATGAIYASDYEHNAIRKMSKDGRWTTIAHGPQLLWPDTLSIGYDGYLYFIVNQVHRQPGFHKGEDKLQKPYALLRIRIDAAPAETR
ncbi:L-dopachrome tautomerase-related protein [Serratia marcescens]|nr:L-dopachrome tautomerase-related protein [Serratia marcescens]